MSINIGLTCTDGFIKIKELLVLAKTEEDINIIFNDNPCEQQVPVILMPGGTAYHQNPYPTIIDETKEKSYGRHFSRLKRKAIDNLANKKDILDGIPFSYDEWRIVRM